MLRLTGSDTALSGSADTVVVAKPIPPGNQPPVVSAGDNQTVSLPDALAILNGSVTDDGLPQGAAVTITWEKASGPGPVGFARDAQGRTTARFTVAGDYVLRLSANDTERVSSSIVQVKVLPDLSNQAPGVGVSAPVRVAYPGPALLTGSVSDDGLPATGTLTVAWTKESGPGTVTFTRPDQATTQATFSAGGTYGLRLTADDGALSTSVLVTIEVLRSNQPPTVSAGPDRQLTYPQRTVTLAGTVQDDGLPQGGTLTSLWTLVEGPGDVSFGTPAQASTSVTLSVSGTYKLRLTASDGTLEASDDVTVVLEGPTNLPPVVDVGPPVSATLPGTLTLGGRATDDGLPNPTLAVTWTQVSGPGTVSFADRTLANTEATFPAAGTYTLRLSANDGESTVSANLVVAGRPGGQNHPPAIDSAPPATARAGVLFLHPVLASDANGDVLTFRLVTGPDGMEVDPRSGLVTWRPGAEDVGTRVPVSVRVSDPAGLFVDQSFELEVLPGDAAPRITSRPTLSSAAGVTYAYAATATDADDTQLTWSVEGPAGMAVSATGHVSWPVPADAQGGFPVVLRVRDPAGHVAEQRFAIGVAVPGGTNSPVVQVTAPTHGERVITKRDITGTVQDDDLAGYDVRACRLGDASGCVTLAEGLAPVSGGRLAELDPMLLSDGRYEVVVSARDAASHVTERRLEVVVATGGRKAPALRLAFPEMRVQTRTAALLLKRVYDGLDLSAGPLGKGWRYEWDSTRITQPRPLAEGWVVSLEGRFIPRFVIRPTVDHPISVRLDDGRNYEFDVTLEHDGSLSSIHPAKPVIRELTSTGASLVLLSEGFSPYSDFDIIVLGDEVYEWDFETLWKPKYGQLKTEFGETIVFDLFTKKLVALEDGAGQKLELAENGVKLNGSELVRFEKGADGLIARVLNVPTGARAVYQRDEQGLLVRATTAEGGVQTFTYDDEGRMVAFTSDGERPERFEYDDKGRVVLHVTATGVAMRTEYDDVARTTTLIDPAGNAVVSEYNADGNITRVTNPLGQTTRFTYKPGTSLETSRTDPLGNVWSTEYDARGRRTALVNPMGERTQVAYSPRGDRILEVTNGAGRRFAENVDSAGRTVAHVQPDGTVSRTFSYPTPDTIVSTDYEGRSRTTRLDSRGREVFVKDENGNEVATTYDDATLTATINRGGALSRVGLDRAGRITRLEMGGGQNVDYTFKGADPMPVAITRPDGVRVEYERNPEGMLTALRVDGQPVQQARFDALGRLASVQRNGSVEQFKYDAAGRVIEASAPRARCSRSTTPPAAWWSAPPPPARWRRWSTTRRAASPRWRTAPASGTWSPMTRAASPPASPRRMAAPSRSPTTPTAGATGSSTPAASPRAGRTRCPTTWRTCRRCAPSTTWRACTGNTPMTARAGCRPSPTGWAAPRATLATPRAT
ncbi:PKD domain-containing protein [Pyxidicoccus sp. 3LG]